MNKRILNIAVPNIISNITIPLLGLVDLALVGHLENELYIGAISLGGMIFNFIYWGFSFLRMGTSGFVAQAYGKRQLNETINLLGRAFFVALSGAFLLILLQKGIGWLSFTIINGSEEVEALAREYFYIRIWAAPATIGIYGLTGWFIGMQNARFPMFIAITVNALNIGFNIFLIKVVGMKSDGVALGTVMAQYSGLILGLTLLKTSYGKLFKYWNRKAILQLKALKLFYSVNKDIFIRTICLIFVLSFFTAKSAANGDMLLAVNTLLMQFFTIFSYLVDGFAYAGEALVGKYTGARDRQKLLKVIRYLFYWAIAIALPFTLLYIFGGKILLQALTNEQDVIRLASKYMFWVWMLPVLTFAAFIWDGIYIGATASTGMRNSMLISTLFIFLPVYFIAQHYLGNHGLWLAFMTFMLSRGITQSFLAKKAVLNKIPAQ